MSFKGSLSATVALATEVPQQEFSVISRASWASSCTDQLNNLIYNRRIERPVYPGAQAHTEPLAVGTISLVFETGTRCRSIVHGRIFSCDVNWDLCAIVTDPFAVIFIK